MTKYLGVEIDAYKWRHYPSEGLELKRLKKMTPSELISLTDVQQKKRKELLNEYISKLITHRAELSSSFKFLNEILKVLESQNNESGIEECNGLIQDHIEKEKNVKNLSNNVCFLSLDYTRRNR